VPVLLTGASFLQAISNNTNTNGVNIFFIIETLYQV
jgi:hypothetical protein